MTELAGQASALAGIGRTVAGAVVGGPVGRAAAVAYGVRHAVGLRRGTAAGGAPAGRAPGRRWSGSGAAMIRRGFWLTVGAVGGHHGLPAGLLAEPPGIADARRAPSQGR